MLDTWDPHQTKWGLAQYIRITSSFDMNERALELYLDPLQGHIKITQTDRCCCIVILKQAGCFVYDSFIPSLKIDLL